MVTYLSAQKRDRMIFLDPASDFQSSLLQRFTLTSYPRLFEIQLFATLQTASLPCGA